MVISTSKNLQNCDKPYFHAEKNKTPYFGASATAREWRRENMGFFLNIIEIGNKDFITILGSTNPNGMKPDTNHRSEPTENVLGGSMTRIEPQ